MCYNLLLGLLCYSSLLTFNLCTIYFYFFNIFSALSAGLTWALNYNEYGSGGSHKGLTDFQVIMILVTCGMYAFVLIVNCKI